ncbi:MAG TPA: hypothetical protein VN688_04545 [Gemmataceae bacterium]|nr:hypothetical protein [Gemmataceae bacterium]
MRFLIDIRYLPAAGGFRAEVLPVLSDGSQGEALHYSGVHAEPEDAEAEARQWIAQEGRLCDA